MIETCLHCGGNCLKLLFNLPNQQGSAYWTCLQCSWDKFIPWWNRKRYIKLEKRLERIEAIQLAARVVLDPTTYFKLKVDPPVKDIDEKLEKK